MKPLRADRQLRSQSLPCSVALQALKRKSSPGSKTGPLDASTDRGLKERSGEVFLLDILSHRMSEIAWLQHQLLLTHEGSLTE
jgi:hypothetical protein